MGFASGLDVEYDRMKSEEWLWELQLEKSYEWGCRSLKGKTPERTVWPPGLNCCFLGAHLTKPPISWSHSGFPGLCPRTAPWCAAVSTPEVPCSLSSVLPALAHSSGIISNVSSSGCFSDSCRYSCGFILELSQHPYHITMTELLMHRSPLLRASPPGQGSCCFSFFFPVAQSRNKDSYLVNIFTQSLWGVYHACTWCYILFYVLEYIAMSKA